MVLEPNAFGNCSALSADPVVYASPLGTKVRRRKGGPFSDSGRNFRVMFDTVAHTVLRKLSISIDETNLRIQYGKQVYELVVRRNIPRRYSHVASHTRR